MYKGWTGFNRVLMGISMGVCFLLIAVIAYVLRDYWWIPVCVGIPVVFGAHCIWGLFVEMSKNIIRIGTNQLNFAKRAQAGQTAGNNYATAPIAGQPVISDMVSEEPVAQDWICSRCTMQNPAINNFCERCGNPKNNQLGGN